MKLRHHASWNVNSWMRSANSDLAGVTSAYTAPPFGLRLAACCKRVRLAARVGALTARPLSFQVVVQLSALPQQAIAVMR